MRRTIFETEPPPSPPLDHQSSDALPLLDKYDSESTFADIPNTATRRLIVFSSLDKKGSRGPSFPPTRNLRRHASIEFSSFHHYSSSIRIHTHTSKSAVSANEKEKRKERFSRRYNANRNTQLCWLLVLAARRESRCFATNNEDNFRFSYTNNGWPIERKREKTIEFFLFLLFSSREGGISGRGKGREKRH